MSNLPQRPSSQPGDGLGYRVLGFDKKTGDRLEMLRVRPQFAGQPNFEAQLRTRIQRLQDFRGTGFARVRQIDKLTGQAAGIADRKSTRLNSSHQIISYAVFCLKKKKKK